MYLVKLKNFTGHMYYGSPYETSSDCGNCDGARCDRCKKIYSIVDWDTDKIKYMGYDEKEADKCLNELKDLA